MAINFGHRELAKILLKDDSFPDYKHMRDDRGYTPLHIACLRGDFLIAQLLLKHDIEVGAKGLDGKTAYDLCLD